MGYLCLILNTKQDVRYCRADGLVISKICITLRYFQRLVDFNNDVIFMFSVFILLFLSSLNISFPEIMNWNICFVTNSHIGYRFIYISPELLNIEWCLSKYQAISKVICQDFLKPRDSMTRDQANQ